MIDDWDFDEIRDALRMSYTLAEVNLTARQFGPKVAEMYQSKTHRTHAIIIRNLAVHRRKCIANGWRGSKIGRQAP